MNNEVKDLAMELETEILKFENAGFDIYHF